MDFDEVHEKAVERAKEDAKELARARDKSVVGRASGAPTTTTVTAD